MAIGTSLPQVPPEAERCSIRRGFLRFNGRQNLEYEGRWRRKTWQQRRCGVEDRPPDQVSFDRPIDLGFRCGTVAGNGRQSSAWL